MTEQETKAENTSPAGAEETGAGGPLQGGFWGRLDQSVRDGLSVEQRGAIETALPEPSWQRHKVNVRFTIPLLIGRYFFTFVAGQENRRGERLKRERKLNPLGECWPLFYGRRRARR